MQSWKCAVSGICQSGKSVANVCAVIGYSGDYGIPTLMLFTNKLLPSFLFQSDLTDLVKEQCDQLGPGLSELVSIWGFGQFILRNTVISCVNVEKLFYVCTPLGVHHCYYFDQSLYCTASGWKWSNEIYQFDFHSEKFCYTYSCKIISFRLSDRKLKLLVKFCECFFVPFTLDCWLLSNQY